MSSGVDNHEPQPSAGCGRRGEGDRSPGARSHRGEVVRLLPIAVLVLSGDRYFRPAATMLLTRRGCTVMSAADGDEARGDAARSGGRARRRARRRRARTVGRAGAIGRRIDAAGAAAGRRVAPVARGASRRARASRRGGERGGRDGRSGAGQVGARSSASSRRSPSGTAHGDCRLRRMLAVAAVVRRRSGSV